MNQHYLFLSVLYILWVGIFSPAKAQKLENLGFHFKSPKTKKIKIDFQQYNNLIVIPVKINDLDTLNFAVDTGVGYTLITDPTVMEKLKLNCLRKIKIAGAGTADELMGCIVNIPSIKIQNIVADNHNVVVLDEDVLNLSRYAGVKIHGLIGYDLFSRFVIKINYLLKVLNFYKPESFKHKEDDGEVFKITIENMKPYVQAEAVLSATNTPIKLILDTGAGHSLSLETGTHPNIRVPEKNITSQLGMTLNGAVEGRIGRIDKFKLGSFEMEKVITSFPDSISLRLVRGASQRQGNLGCGVLKRFHIIFDYPREKLILKPNRNYKEPFEFNTSGLDLIAEGDNFKKISIGGVRKNSPGDEVGLMQGDRIMAIDNTMAYDISLSEAYKLINKKEGKRTLLLVQRKDAIFFVELILRQPI